jgi:hypothetical protein
MLLLLKKKKKKRRRKGFSLHLWMKGPSLQPRLLLSNFLRYRFS